MTTNDTTADGPDVPGDSPANPVTLESLVSSVQPTKKIAKLRQMLPEIDQMQEKGLTNIEIIEALRKVGFVITEQYFSTAVRRLRGEKPKPRKGTKKDRQEKDVETSKKESPVTGTTKSEGNAGNNQDKVGKGAMTPKDVKAASEQEIDLDQYK